MSQHVMEQAILLSLETLFEKAEAESLWFYHHSKEAGEVWCSPKYLRLCHDKGRYIWGPDNWELRSPLVYMKQLKYKAQELVEEYNHMAERMQLEEKIELASVSSNPADLPENLPPIDDSETENT